MDFELTRSENDEKLLTQIDSIQTAENIQVLIPFAKAYLGMFYVIEKELAEKEKVKLLANDKLSEAVFSGFIASLERKELPSIEQIAHAKAEKKEFSEGYVVLAGLDLIAKKSLTNVSELDDELIEKAIAFHFSNQSGYCDIWFEHLLVHHKNKVSVAMSKYWVALLKNNASYLPGKNLVLGTAPDIEIIENTILALLENWSNCKVKTLLQLLRLAFIYGDKDKLLQVCEKVLVSPDSLRERAHLYWLAAAYLLAPEKYSARLSDYVGRVKLKIMPLLDFIVLMLESGVEVNVKSITQLLRMIAPVFPPQHHVYGAIGSLDINSKNVMLLFYHLAQLKGENIIGEVKSLRKARVMKIYSGVIDNLLDIHVRRKNENDFSFPDFNAYIDALADNNCLQGRSNKFDLR